MRISVVNNGAPAGQIEVSESLLVIDMLGQVVQSLHVAVTSSQELMDHNGNILNMQLTVQETGLHDGDTVFLVTRAGAGGMSPEHLMNWLSALVDQAKAIPVEDLMKYMGWVVTASKAVELMRTGVKVFQQLINRHPEKLESVIKEIRSKPSWSAHDLSERTGLSIKDTKGVLRLLGFCYNRRTSQYEIGA